MHTLLQQGHESQQKRIDIGGKKVQPFKKKTLDHLKLNNLEIKTDPIYGL